MLMVLSITRQHGKGKRSESERLIKWGESERAIKCPGRDEVDGVSEREGKRMSGRWREGESMPELARMERRERASSKSFGTKLGVK